MDQYTTQSQMATTESTKGDQKALLRNSLSNHRRLKPPQSSFGQLGARNQLWVESLKDLGDHQLS